MTLLVHVDKAFERFLDFTVV